MPGDDTAGERGSRESNLVSRALEGVGERDEGPPVALDDLGGEERAHRSGLAADGTVTRVADTPASGMIMVSGRVRGGYA